MATAQELIDLATELTNVVKAANKIVNQQNLPFDTDTQKLVNDTALLAEKANRINQAGLSALANEVGAALGQLKTQVAVAEKRLKQLNDVEKALNVVGVVLVSAVSVAGSVATGNWIGVANNVLTMAASVKAAAEAN